MKKPYALHWFRRDLRIVGNPGLDSQLASHPGRVLGIFCIDPDFLARKDISHGRFLFFLETLRDVRDRMRARGGDLLVLEGSPTQAIPAFLDELAKSELGAPASLSFCRDYEPYARARDQRMVEELQERLEVRTERDHLLIEPHELLKDDGTYYKVYTPFKNRWLALLSGTPENDDVPHRVAAAAKGLRAGEAQFALQFPRAWQKRGDALLDRVVDRTAKDVSHPIPEAGHATALRTMKAFAHGALDGYTEGRDIPSIPGTSRLSIYFKNGSITVPQVVAALKLHERRREKDALKFLEELIWREFYYHILFHRPDVETGAFQEKYRKLPWENDRKLFDAWCEGRTGYPIVDAAMRQLNSTGWMHNRLRMIVASFLVKDLLIDWRWGERWFMKKLLDGDLAPNNGGWQWAASTGTDAQPYFRIFNPTSQGEKFDPEAKFLKEWAPEYVNGRKKPHEPLNPIVDHAARRERAIAMFKGLSSP